MSFHFICRFKKVTELGFVNGKPSRKCGGRKADLRGGCPFAGKKAAANAPKPKGHP